MHIDCSPPFHIMHFYNKEPNIFYIFAILPQSFPCKHIRLYCVSWMFTSSMFSLDIAVNNISRFIHVRDCFNPLTLKIIFSGSLVVLSLSERTCTQNTHSIFFLIPLPLPGCLPEVAGIKSNFYVLRTHKSHCLNLILMCHKWEVLNLKVHVLAGSLISCGRGLYAVGGSDIDSPSLCEFLKTCWKCSPDHSGVMYAKLVLMKWELMGGASVTALNKGLARA